MPEAEDPGLYKIVLQVPMDAVPLFMTVAVLHQSQAGKPAGTCVTTCLTLIRALEHLGFSAEPLAACASVFSRDTHNTKITDVGVWEHPPVVRPDGTTNGHMIVWSPSFRRMIDPTIAQAPVLLEAARTSLVQSYPSVLQVDHEALLSTTVTAPRGPYTVTWTVFPQWTPILTGMLAPAHHEAIEHAAVRLAGLVVEQLPMIGQIRDQRALHSLHPHLGALLSGRALLPDPPALSPQAAALFGL
jgi:hypothetical protein